MHFKKQSNLQTNKQTTTGGGSILQTMDHHKEGTVVFYESKNRDTQLFCLRHDKPLFREICADLHIYRSDQLIQITKSNSWRPELIAKVVKFFNDMLFMYAKGELTKAQVGQKKRWFMAQAVMPLRRPKKRTLQKGIVATPAARDTAVSEATKSAASDTVDLANKRQKCTSFNTCCSNSGLDLAQREAVFCYHDSAEVSHSGGAEPSRALIWPYVPPPPVVFSDTF